MVLGEKLNNPYALEVMQAAVESLTPADKPVPTLMVTDLYVRFLPKDSTELAILYDVEKLELFDYPLDYEIMVEGDYYHDPSIPEGNPTWLYTTVAPDYEFPDVEYEILETCYIPQEVSVKSSSSDTFSPEDLEREAYRLAGLDSMWIDGPLTRAAEYPSGKFTVYDTETQEYVPVKGVKIRVHNIIKWATAYTDQNGCYTIGKKYRTNVHYAMVFKNTKGFKVWGNWAMLVSLVYHSGDTGNFNDIVNHNSVSVYSLILADKFGKIFHSPILNEELKNNPDFGSWKETTNSKTTKWTFICNRTEPIFSN